MRLIAIYIAFVFSGIGYGQGVNNLWLIGYQSGLDSNTVSKRGTIDFNSGVAIVDTSNRKMKFNNTQGNISDANGNLLIASNGIWIANATGDTMMNGSGLNPNSFTDDYSINGLILPYGNVFLPWPDDSTKYILFHMTGSYGGNALNAAELYYSVIDMTLDNALGAVTLKNQIALQDELSWGIGVCKHANGRDWWIIVMKDNSNKLYKVLLTPSGIQSVTDQTFADTICYLGNAFQPVFSPDGNKFAFYTGYYPSASSSYFVSKVSYFDFDRCTGMFSNHQMIDISDGYLGFGTMFSTNSKYLYASTIFHIYQVNTDTIPYTVDTIATYDGYAFPYSLLKTDFWLMYRAADNNIYITSGNSVLDLHVIESPDSAGLACNVQQHSLHLPCYNNRGVPNHPNYFLGADSASICDSLTVSINEPRGIHKNLCISPNPATSVITINAQSVKGKAAELYIYDAMGHIAGKRKVNINNGYVTQDVIIDKLSKGMYIVRLETEEGVRSSKFVKQ